MSLDLSFDDSGYIPEVWRPEETLPEYYDTYEKPKDLETIDKFQTPKEATSYGFKDPLKPYIPENLKKLIEKGKRSRLNEKEMVKLMEGIAEISTEFYELKEGKYVAIGFDGKILESADSQVKLLMKIQGREFQQDLFLWRVGSGSFTGW